jgi:hypothetical protein
MTSAPADRTGPLVAAEATLAATPEEAARGADGAAGYAGAGTP